MKILLKVPLTNNARSLVELLGYLFTTNMFPTVAIFEKDFLSLPLSIDRLTKVTIIYETYFITLHVPF